MAFSQLSSKFCSKWLNWRLWMMKNSVKTSTKVVVHSKLSLWRPVKGWWSFLALLWSCFWEVFWAAFSMIPTIGLMIGNPWAADLATLPAVSVFMDLALVLSSETLMILSASFFVKITACFTNDLSLSSTESSKVRTLRSLSEVIFLKFLKFSWRAAQHFFTGQLKLAQCFMTFGDSLTA